MQKRLFFGVEVEAPWPDKLPHGRTLDPQHRHLTLAFLGDTDWGILEQALPNFPKPPFKIGFAGRFDELLLLPPRHPSVAAWHVSWLEDTAAIIPYQQTLIAWLKEIGLKPDTRHGFLPHVTLCRQPFNPHQWTKAFVPMPMITGSIHLYESVGGLRYQPIWTHPLHRPFTEIEHTADIAFRISGDSLTQLQIHAFAALACHCPSFLHHLPDAPLPDSLDAIVLHLNRALSHIDIQEGAPFKAISYHGNAAPQSDGTLEWEMIIDV